MRARLAALLALGLMAGDASGGGERLTVRRAEVTMPASSRLDFMGGIELRSSIPVFGGLSGIELSADGARYVAVSDSGRWAEGRLVRDRGRLTGATLDALIAMRGPDGGREPPSQRDAEGLAIAAPDLSGERLVSFERDHRISAFAAAAAPERLLWSRREWSRFPINNGFEALALRQDGVLLALQEADRGKGLQAAIWLTPDGAVRPALMPRQKGLIATGADFGPDGRLYVVDRGLSVFGGFSMRIRRLTVRGDALIGEEELLRLPGAWGADNAEGIAAWRDADGRIRVTVVTDDNYNLLQRTLLLEFALRD